MSWIEKYERRIWGYLLSKSDHEELRKWLFFESLKTVLLLKREREASPGLKTNRTPFPFNAPLLHLNLCFLATQLLFCVQRECPRLALVHHANCVVELAFSLKDETGAEVVMWAWNFFFFFVISHGWELAEAGSLFWVLKQVTPRHYFQSCADTC